MIQFLFLFLYLTDYVCVCLCVLQECVQCMANGVGWNGKAGQGAVGGGGGVPAKHIRGRQDDAPKQDTLGKEGERESENICLRI